ncbi:hypothetical protein, partial [Nocardia salmonicida]|uniref:hypothetical protein n=1 Tax=Nocardia salmonicida TaxID=53431 RepID=UPI0034084726
SRRGCSGRARSTGGVRGSRLCRARELSETLVGQKPEPSSRRLRQRDSMRSMNEPEPRGLRGRRAP